MITDPTTITPEEITEYRKEFADKPEALYALDIIAEYDGDLVESATLLDSKSGTRDLSDFKNILDSLALECRDAICHEAFDDLMDGLLSAAVATFAATGQIPEAVATPVVIYVARIGVDNFCQSSSEESKNP